MKKDLWAVVLAAGEGVRTRSLILRWLGNYRPKQYCTFVGTRSLLQHTLDRVERLTSRQRTIVIVDQSHYPDASKQVRYRQPGKLILQPCNCDTAAGIFLPLTYIRCASPQATVVILPSDHFIYPEDPFLVTVRQAAEALESRPNRLVLLGIAPDYVETEYGWIEPDRDASVQAYGIRPIRAFIEKPDFERARAAMLSGALWNTLIMVGKVNEFWRLGLRAFPEMMPLFQRLEKAIRSSQEHYVLDSIYAGMPRRNFSSELLQRFPGQVDVIQLRDVLWSDWGRPERIVSTLREIDRQPAFPLECLVGN